MMSSVSSVDTRKIWRYRYDDFSVICFRKDVVLIGFGMSEHKTKPPHNAGESTPPKKIKDKTPEKVPGTKRKAKEKEEESKEEAEELLNFIRQSEYSIIDQLNRTPAKITLLSLIMSSEPHRKALLKVLNEAYVPHSTSQDKFEGMLSQTNQCLNEISKF
ncbi:hypothetical protein Fmac_024797 [Flemingia macrophylla]|uniref:Uncharacterized protein n=1 Tax=Flemingia macrophylla TaxID=520843 RepID=A0ABD1LQF1_9FABA